MVGFKKQYRLYKFCNKHQNRDQIEFVEDFNSEMDMVHFMQNDQHNFGYTVRNIFIPVGEKHEESDEG